MNGLGADSRDKGQSRVPAPPERMIGISAISASYAIKTCALYPMAAAY
jgi:hypothetical protein